MTTNIEKVISKIKNGKLTIGSWMQIPSTDVAEIMGKSGYDWIAVDLEHGGFSYETVTDINRAIELGGTVPVARVGQVSQKDIKKALDTGARGLIYPMIDSAELLKQAIGWSEYPPNGSRGVGFSRANNFGKEFDQYLTTDSKSIFKIAQIEHVDAVRQIDEIMKVDGLDGILIGPYDLSGSMGLTGEFGHPKFIETLDHIKARALKQGISMGMHIVMPDKKKLKEKIKDGYSFIAYGTDAVFLYSNCSNPLND